MGLITVIPAERAEMTVAFNLARTEKPSFAYFNWRTFATAMVEGNLLVAMLDDLVLGFIQVHESSAKYWTVERMVVAKPVRERGVGSLLLATVTGEADAAMVSLRTSIFQDSEAGLRLFRKHHFTITSGSVIDGRKKFFLNRECRFDSLNVR